MNTADFPQADVLDKIIEVPAAVAAGHVSDLGIENYLGGFDSDGRQGRYYRLAAEIATLVSNSHNVASLTTDGVRLLELPLNERRLFVAQRLLERELFQRMMRYVRSNQPTEAQLSSFVSSLYPGAETTANRRAPHTARLLIETELVEMDANGRLRPTVKGGAARLRRVPDSSGIGGRPVKWRRSGRHNVSSGFVIAQIDRAKHERANAVHAALVGAKGIFLSERGFKPKDNKFVDLFVDATRAKTVLYEMKSVSGEFVGQIRRAVSQLYEYRYTFSVPYARLCIVLNKEPTGSDAWLLDYLEKDRSIALCWTSDFTSFQCTRASKKLLGTFAP